MRIIDAMSLRDGGTTCVTVEKDGATLHITIDHALSGRGTDRLIRLSTGEAFGRDELVLGCDRERELVLAVVKAVQDELGSGGSSAWAPGQSIPRSGHWRYVSNFLRIVRSERPRGYFRG